MISGKVLSERGLMAANISVSFKNKSNSVITNADGTFKIMATHLPDTLVFSAVGFEPYKVVVTEKTVKDPEFEIVLLEERAKLDEVVVTGYRPAGGDELDGTEAGVVMEAPIVRADGYKSKGRRSRTISTWGSASVSYSHDMAASASYSSASEEYAGSSMAGRTLHFTNTVVPKEITYRTQLLSAGEVNDFKKWKMWEDYNAGEFQTYSERWSLFPSHRYAVQLQNDKHVAVVGQPVYLLDKATKDTVWRAVTDNTGKAELWSGFNKKDSSEYMIAAGGNSTSKRASEFANGVNAMTVNNDCRLSDKVELAFVVDATGSMQDEIEYLKLELEDVIRKTFEKNKGLDLNVGSVFYRDFGDEYLTRHINFQSDLLKVINFIKLQRADGGGDYPEAVNAALRTAIDSMTWSSDARSKILFIVLDAPPHNEAAAEMFQLAQKAAAKGIRIVPIGCSGTDKSTEFIMRSIALATNGTYLFLTDHSGIGNPHIKPTTDAFDVELLNTLLSRTIEQMIYSRPCDEKVQPEEPIKPAENINSIKLYPNPTKGKFVIQLSQQVKDIFITDFTGKVLLRIVTKAGENKYDVDLSAYPSATYIVRYITDENRWGSEKVVVMR